MHNRQSAPEGRPGQRGEDIGGRPASETRGAALDRERTQSRTVAKAGSAAMTAPNPTRLATLTAGSTGGICARISMLWRNSGRRVRLRSTTVAIAAASAATTDHTPATALIEVVPQRASAR